jgi:hypothetical protein
MATRTRTRTVVRRSSSRGGAKLAKMKTAATTRARRLKNDRDTQKGDLLGIAAAGLMGWADREGWTDRIPVIGEIGAVGTLGALLYLAPMVVKSTTGRTLQSAGAGLLSATAYQMAETWGED